MHNPAQVLAVMAVYMLIVIAIGVFFAKRANASSGNYFLGGRTLGPWVTAMSAEASDMSGWLLMGLPGVAYWLRLRRRLLDGARPRHRHLRQLALRQHQAAQLFRDHGRRHHHPRFFLAIASMKKRRR